MRRLTLVLREMQRVQAEFDRMLDAARRSSARPPARPFAEIGVFAIAESNSRGDIAHSNAREGDRIARVEIGLSVCTIAEPPS